MQAESERFSRERKAEQLRQQLLREAGEQIHVTNAKKQMQKDLEQTSKRLHPLQLFEEIIQSVESSNQARTLSNTTHSSAFPKPSTKSLKCRDITPQLELFAV